MSFLSMPMAATRLQQPIEPAPDAFIWGKGGRRMTPEQVAKQRAMAEKQGASDYSPIGHWSQGLGRIADGAMSGVQMKRANKAADANTAESAAVMEALLADGADNSAVLEALANPNVSSDVKRIAEMQFKRLNPAPAKPTAFESLMLAAGLEPGSQEWQDTAMGSIRAKNDPEVVTNLPGDRFYAGRMSGLKDVLGQPSGGASTQPPPEAIAELKSDPTGAAEFDEVFGQGAAAKVLGGGGGNVTSGFLEGF